MKLKIENDFLVIDLIKIPLREIATFYYNRDSCEVIIINTTDEIEIFCFDGF